MQPSAWLGSALLLALALAPIDLWAGAPIETIRYSSDVSGMLAAVQVDDETLIADDRLGVLAAVDLGALPMVADLEAYHLETDGDQLFSLDTTVTFPGGVVAGAGDIVRYEGAGYTLAFLASDHALPAGISVDAISTAGGDLLLSFDTSVDLGGQVADDEDLVIQTGASLMVFFDGSGAGIPSSLAIDAAHHVERDGRLFLSFDGSGRIQAIDFDDEDVLEYRPAIDRWTLVYDASAEQSAWLAADLDALYVATLDTTSFIGVYRPSQNRFYLDLDDNGAWSPPGDGFFTLGIADDVPIVGDWDGDGDDEIGVYRPGNRRFYLDLDGSYSWGAGDGAFPLGIAGDLPVIGDWDGDGSDEIGVYRPGNNRFYLDLDGSRSWTPGVDGVFAFGIGGDLPAIGDWNGDGTDELGVYRPGNNRFYLDLDGSRSWTPGVDGVFAFGIGGDRPVIGDWDGDEIDAIGVYRPSNSRFYLDVDGSGSWSAGDAVYPFGIGGDLPVAGRWARPHVE